MKILSLSKYDSSYFYLRFDPGLIKAFNGAEMMRIVPPGSHDNAFQIENQIQWEVALLGQRVYGIQFADSEVMDQAKPFLYFSNNSSTSGSL